MKTLTIIGMFLGIGLTCLGLAEGRWFGIASGLACFIGFGIAYRAFDRNLV